MAYFVEKKSKKNENFKFWWQYIDVFSILLLFTRTQRECILELYVTSFTSMIPLFMRHNHYNYARWRTIYVAEIKELPEEINEELVKGGFVVKCSTNMFNQVDPNHTQEWLNYSGKRAGGMRWSLSFNVRSHFAKKEHKMYKMLPDIKIAKETTPSRSKRDSDDEQAMLDILPQRFKMFSNNAPKVTFAEYYNLLNARNITIYLTQ